MSKQCATNWEETGGHPTEDDLRLYLDGELEATASVKTHLEACWSCRVELDKVQETISDFIEYRNQVLRPLVTPPPGSWRGFDTRFTQLSHSAGKRSWWAQFVAMVGKSFANLRAHGRGWTLSRLMIRFAVGSAVLLTLAVAWFIISREPAVTATELLRRTEAAQMRRILEASQPVIHQRVQVKRSRGAQIETALLETWHDLNNSRFRQIVDSNNSSGLLNMLERIYQTSRLDWRRPLSAVAFAEWRKSIQDGREIVSQIKEDGVDFLALRAVSAAPPRLGAVYEAVLTVRARDWQPFRQTLKVKEESGEAEYELTETSSEVISLAAVNPVIFAEPLAAAVASTPTPRPALTPSISPSPTPAGFPTPATASLELEVETLTLLSQVGADLGEQINVKRAPQGLLRIEGLVETEERKQQLRRALKTVLQSAAVSFEIETIEEAARRSFSIDRPAAPPAPVLIEQPTITTSALPVDAELHLYFSGKVPAERLDDEIRRFASRALNASFDLRQRAHAMKRLTERFTPAEWRALDERSQIRLAGVLRAHAAAIHAQSRSLRQSLQLVFGASEPAPASAESDLAGADELWRAVARLIELSAVSDRGVQSAFTLSTEPASAAALKASAFWRALFGVERLAAEIENQMEKR